jgi:hypothetical protein
MRLPKLLTTSLLIAAIHNPAWPGELENGMKALEAQHYSEALNILLPLANSGNAEAQRLIGEMSFNAQGMKKNAIAAFKWNELSAAGGNAIAQFNLGYLYEHGEGVQRSDSNALDWYTKAALQDYVPAERKLGDLYADSDRTKAIYWYDKARQAGDQQALQKFSQLSSQQQKEIADIEREQAKKRRIEEAEADAKWQQEQQALRQKWAQEAEENASTPTPTASPFQGLDAINKVMRDGQRTIAVAQAERARQQQWQKEAEAPRRADTRDLQPTALQHVAVDASSKTPKKSTSMNTGKSAMQCVSVTRNNDDVEFRNTCDKQIFVVWCGDLKYAKEKCGDGPKGNSYYTHSNNIKPGTSIRTSVSGQYHYAACEGGIAFGKDEIHDRPDGSFTCIPE